MELNEISFGNPTRQHQFYLKKENYLDSLMTELSSMAAPLNDSEAVDKELQDLVKYTSALNNDAATQERYDSYDDDISQYMIGILVRNGLPQEEVTAIVFDLFKDTTPLLYKLKYKHQRIRPAQLSILKKIDLNVYDSSMQSPSYPSGHCFQSKIYAEVLGNAYPKYYTALKNLAFDIANSRLYKGLNYLSDLDYASYAADLVMQHPDFRKKYKL